MKKSILYLVMLVLGGVALMSLPACSEDKFGPSIFPEEGDVLDPNSVTYEFDKWLDENYRKPYNVKYLYKMEDVGTNMNYNLIPADYDKAVDLALLVKYLWFDVYSEVAASRDTFLKENAPRVLHIIGSAAMNPNSGYETVGLAEGGVKVNLFKVNQMNLSNFDMMNEYYFKTMHHEFAHILHQKINYPKEFDEITNTKYEVNDWTSRGGTEHDGVVNSLGFVSKYASSAKREDFAEVVANRVTMTDEDWDAMMVRAGQGWAKYEVTTGTFYCAYFYFDNNKAGDENKSYFLSSMGYTTKVDENGDMTLVRYGKDVYQLAVLPITDENIYDQTGTLVRVNHTDANGNRAEKAEDGNWLVVDVTGNFIPIKVYPVEDDDDIDGVQAINQKLEIASKWLKDQWGVDIEMLRAEVQKRQNEYKADPEALIKRLRREAFGHE
ncbi:MAG: hypothetical protein IJT30_04170 [Muribaculaceae bacterium]|nr:hypothetical protein [Muribaculaceae bacterium]